MYIKLACLLVCALGVSSDVLESGIKGEISPYLAYLGEADGKKYYADIAQKGTWDTAKAYCTNLGMKLASIETLPQAALLNSKTNEVGVFVGDFWTAGRDALELRQYSWDGTDTQPLSHPVEGAQLVATGLVKNSCLIYNASPSVHRYTSKPCTTSASALCET